MSNIVDRRSHAILDAESRLSKAAKIVRLLETYIDLKNAKVLEIGAGSGYIAAHLGEVTGPRGKVHAIDCNDELQITNGLTFTEVDDTSLPFPGESFDIVVTNHVIEHVGNRMAQEHHLKEIRRVLRANGIAYLAVPNRWTILEPHFKLPFLSWLPKCLRSTYVRAFRKGTHYDCNLLSKGDTVRLLKKAGLVGEHVSFKAFYVMCELERVSQPIRWASLMPKWMLLPCLPIIPTLVFILRKSP